MEIDKQRAIHLSPFPDQCAEGWQWIQGKGLRIHEGRRADQASFPYAMQ